MTVLDDRLADLTAETSLRQVYGLVRQLPRRGRYDVLVITVFVFTGIVTSLSDATTSEIAKQAREISGAGFQFAGTILGIVLAGFAIFTTVATSPIVAQFALFHRKKPKVSELKFLTLHFVAAAVPYMAFVVVHFAGLSVCWPGGPGTSAAHYLGDAISRWISVVILSALTAFCAHLMIVLQALIFNVYISFMTMARGKLELDARKRDDQNPPVPPAGASS